MKITRFGASAVHGYLSFELTFDPRLTFLTGINGSGKTSALKAITALLTPSLRDLANIDHGSLTVTVEHDGEEVGITSIKTPEELQLSCSTIPEPLCVPIIRSSPYEPSYRFNRREADFYREIETVNLKHPVLQALDKLPSPMYLDLERRHLEGPKRRSRLTPVRPSEPPDNSLAGSLVESLHAAESLAERTYRQLLARRTVLTDNLKHEIILSAFDLDATPSTLNRWLPAYPPFPTALSQIQSDERLLPSTLNQIGISTEQIEGTVKPFFNKAREVVLRMNQFNPNPNEGISSEMFELLQEWSSINPAINHISRLARLINAYNKDVTATFRSTDNYIRIVNNFLKDSGKELYFDSAGNLRLRVGDASSDRPISSLSSGERQIVVILTHLALNLAARRANVLIIDEPELSLHLRWQEIFVDALREASRDVQLILATHSPSIIGSRIRNCVDVQEAQHGDRLLR